MVSQSRDADSSDESSETSEDTSSAAPPAKSAKGGKARKAGRRPARFTMIVGGVLAFVVALVAFLVWQHESFGSTDGGHVGIVRNGGPFDNTKIRQVLPASSGRTNIGFASTIHAYPTSQRFFTISKTGNGDSDESIQVPTADGVQVGIEGTAYFTLNTDSANGYAVLCKTCQQIDILSALPKGLTTLVLGNGSGLSIAVPTK